MLNPQLHQALQNITGAGIDIVNAGEEMRGSYEADDLTLRTRHRISTWGEMYRLNCPFCGDQRRRMYVSHRLGVFDHQLGFANFSLWKCHNEDCQADRACRARFREMIEPELRGVRSRLQPMPATSWRASRPDPVNVAEYSPPALPQVYGRVHELPDDHRAVRFLRQRGFNASLAGEHYEILHCHHDVRMNAEDRIIAPLLFGDAYAGWLGRYVDGGDSKPPEGVAKWWTAPGSRVSQTFFGHDEAVSWPFLVVVEGPFDVLGVGSPNGRCLPGPALGVIGKNISSWQAAKLKEIAGDKPVLVMLDGDAGDAIDRAGQKLAGHQGGVHPIRLPDGLDPADLPHADVWRLMAEACPRVRSTFVSHAPAC